MKKLMLFLFLLTIGTGTIVAQQDVNYTHFMFNKLAFNPAYAGSKEALTIGTLYRHQWEGIEGAPRTVTAFAHTPFMKNRAGAGLSITSDHAGMVSNNYIDMSYAYRIPAGERGTLSIGVLGRLEMSNIDWTQARTLEVGDETVPTVDEGRTAVNFGTGVYYSSKKFYVGASAPMLLRSTLYRTEDFAASDVSRQRSYYLMGGFVIPVNKNIMFKPGMMMTFNPNAPFEMDLNASFLFMNALWTGLSYRLGDSVDALVQYQFTPQLKAGFAFDFTTSELNTKSNATFEVMAEYTLKYNNDGVDNIRFF